MPSLLYDKQKQRIWLVSTCYLSAKEPMKHQYDYGEWVWLSGQERGVAEWGGQI